MGPIPISLITGFLGAGKSTLINRIIATFPQLRFALVLNEFGDVALESQIVEASRDEIYELSNGCMCCVVRTDMKDAVRALVDRASRTGRVDHIVMEASGLSDPVPIAQTFLEDDLDGVVRLDALVCVVDALQFPQSIEDYEVTRSQLGAADFVLLSKTDLATPDEVARTETLVERLAPDARIMRLDGGTPLGLIFDASGVDHGNIRDLEREPAHVHEEIETLFFRSDRPLSLRAFGDLIRRLPDGVVRAKGFICTDEEPETKLILQCAGSRTQMEPRPWGAEETRQTALVFIGRGFDAGELRRRLLETRSGIRAADQARP